MDPLLYPNIIKHGRQLDFHEFSNTEVPRPEGRDQTLLHLLQGDSLMSLTDSMMGNLMLVFRQDHLGERQGEEGGWTSGSMYEFCYSVMFEATFLTMYGRQPSTVRHSGMGVLREDFIKFDTMSPSSSLRSPSGCWDVPRRSAKSSSTTSFRTGCRVGPTHPSSSGDERSCSTSTTH
ncbi:hypothetical protein INR49_026868 [Caranx melampygus]|nr:hypothetical protein INR49_026868 [Caranx melampygus]